jgi:hypothetical protein
MGRVTLQWLRSHVVGTVAVVGLLVVGSVYAVPAIARYGPDHLGGQTRVVTLTWQCWDHIQWKQPGTSWTWVGAAGDSPPAKLATSELATGDTREPTEQARGRMHFDSNTEATFTSEAEGTLRFQRHGSPYFTEADCAIGR